MKTRNLVLAVAALALAACNNENEAVVTPVALTVNANITDVSNTRVGTTSFDANDVIGVSVKSNNNYDGLTEGTNVKYTAEAVSSTDSNNGKIVFKSTTPIYFADGKTVTFSAYYPYNADVKSGSTAITLNTTGQTATDAKQSDYDFLYAEADGSVADKDGISMTFSHKMAKLTFTFVAGSGVKDDADFFKNFTGTYKVEGLKHDGKFDTADGSTSFATDAKAEDITPAVPGENTAVTNGKETNPSSIIIYPQTPEDKTVKVTLTYNEVAYIATLGLPTDGFTAGNNYAYTVTLNQTGLTISESTIVDWVTKDQTGVDAEYEYPYDIKDQGKDDSSAAGLAYDEEEELLFN
jgi:hypothetical protein